MRTLPLVVLLGALPALAEFKVSISPSDRELGTEDAVEITVELSDPPPGVTIAWPTSPDLEPLKRTSSSGRREGLVESKSEMRAFRPTRTGALVFPVVEVRTPLGTTVATEPVALTVVKGHVSTATRASSPRKRLYAGLTVPAGGKDFFLSLSSSPEQPTLGDVLRVRLDLFIREGVTFVQFDEIKLDLGALSTAIELPLDEEFQQDIDGVRYRAVPLRSVRALPLSVGGLKPLEASLQVRATRDGEPKVLTAVVPSLTVLPADDPRRSFTAEEGLALLQRKLGALDRLALKLRGPAKQGVRFP
jgi:hypothetical protein